MKNHVQLFRRQMEWTQHELAAYVDVTRECINAIENGRFLPSITLAYTIASEFGRSVYEVFPPPLIVFPKRPSSRSGGSK